MSVQLVAQVPRVEVVEEAVEIAQLPFVKKIGVIPETIEIPHSLSVRGVVQNTTDSGSSIGGTQQQHNHHRKQQRQQAGQTEEEEKEEGEESVKEERRKKGMLRNKRASGLRST